MQTKTWCFTRWIKKMALFCVPVFMAVVWGSFVEEGQATILTFDEARDATSGTIVVPTTAGSVAQQDYGDNVTGSPMDVSGGQFTYGNDGEGFTQNIVVDYFTGTDVRLWAIQYGDLTNVLFARAPISGTANPETLNVRLTADPGYTVQLYHFELGGWANSDYTINSVEVIGETATMYSQSDVLVQGDFNGPRHSSFDFTASLSAQQLLIQIDFSNLAGGIQDNIGIDNIRFGQNPPAAIPVPGTVWLFGSGLLGILGMLLTKLNLRCQLEACFQSCL